MSNRKSRVGRPVESAPMARTDPPSREAHLKRLRRIEGQIRGLQKMIEDERQCVEVLTQLTAVEQALRSVGRQILKNHLHHCVHEAIRAGGESARTVSEELVALLTQQTR